MFFFWEFGYWFILCVFESIMFDLGIMVSYIVNELLDIFCLDIIQFSGVVIKNIYIRLENFWVWVLIF